MSQDTVSGAAPPDSQGQCPPAETWDRVACGLLPSGQESSLTEHAGLCEQCGELLRQSLLHFAAQPTPEESALIAELPSSTPVGLDEIAFRLASPGTPAPRRRARYSQWALAATLTAAVLGGSLFVWRRSSRPPLTLLARAYSIQRVVELRVPNASHAPLQLQRGPGALPATAELLEAMAGIRKHLDASPNDPDWLHAQGRADVLSWRFREAIRAFQAAWDLGAATPDFFTDFGIAYFERAEANDSRDDYSTALEFFSKALALQPRHPSALFNRAIVASRLHLIDSAIADLEAFLGVEPDEAWRSEARAKLDELRRLRSNLFSPRPVPPPEFSAEAGFEQTLLSIAADRDRPRLEELAGNLRVLHHDPWLTGFLRVAPIAAWAAAAEALSRLANVRAQSRADLYQAEAATISRVRHASLPAPLAVWRDFELLSISVRSGAAGDCSSLLSAPDRAALAGYRWFAIQSYLEASTCATASNRLDLAATLTSNAVSLARDSSFRIAFLRAQGFLASHLVNEGRYREAAQAGHSALSSIFNAGYPIRRAHEFYNVQMRWADQIEHNMTARSSAHMARMVAQKCGYGLLEMIAAAKEATFAQRAGLHADAEALFRLALRLRSSLSPGPVADAYEAFALAGLYESRRDISALNNLRAPAGGFANLLFEIPFLQTIARAGLAASQPQRSVDALSPLWPRLKLSRQGDILGMRRDLALTASLLTRALMETRQFDQARSVWRQFLLREAALLGSSSTAAETPGFHTLAPLGSRLASWRNDTAADRPIWLPQSEGTLAAQARRLRRLCSSPRTPIAAINDSVRELVSGLFLTGPSAPAASPNGQLRLCARGDLNALPLSLLLAGATLSPCFQSASFVPFPLHSRGPQSASSPRALVIDASTASAPWAGQLPPLLNAAAEVRDTASVLGAGILAGRAATPAALDRAAAQAGILHFTGHAVPWRDGIALLVSPDPADPRPEARLGLWRIDPARPLPGSLIVFAACSTAAGADLRTVTPAHLAEAALLAGARAVVASLWDVDSAAAVRFNAEFYKRIAAGQRPALAAFEASLALRRISGYEHPYYWAPFVVFESAD